MKNRMITIAILLGFSSEGVALAEPIAPSANIEAQMEMFFKPGQRTVPDTSRVGVPIYPGSLFCTNGGERGKNGWNEVFLLSTDAYEKVSSWYREHMKNWYCKEWAKGIQLKCSDKDPGPAGNYMEIPNVIEVTKQGNSMLCDVKGVKSSINIKFSPD